MNRPTEQPQSFSPFAQRPWTWGFSGISTDRSMDGKTIMVGTVPKATVTLSQFTYQAR